jgi:hypothetical protein
MNPNKGPASLADVLFEKENEDVVDSWRCGRGGAKALAKSATSSSAAVRRATGKV